MDALSELPSTPDTFVRTEESIGDMPLSPSGCGMVDNLAVNSHNEVDARSCGCYHLLALSARRCCIIDPGRFLTVGCQRQEEGIEVRCLCNIGRHRQSCRHSREIVQKQASEGGLYGENIFAQQSSSDVSSDPNEWSHSWATGKPKNPIKITINNGDSETTPL